MSTAMLCRILQGMYPSPPLPVPQLLGPAAMSRLTLTNPNAEKPDGSPGENGLSGGFSTGTYAGHVNTLILGHGGDDLTGDSQCYHVTAQPRAP